MTGPTTVRGLRVATVAPRLVPGAVEANLIRVESLVREAARAQAPDLIVLPEDLTAVGGTSALRRAGRQDVARPVDGALLHLLRHLARETGCVVGGGARLVRGADAYLTYVLAEPDGRVHLHDQGKLSAIQRLTLRAGDDDGITSVVAWGRRRVGLLCGAEWDDRAHVDRLRQAGVDLLIGGRHGTPRAVDLADLTVPPATGRTASAAVTSSIYWARRLAHRFPWQDCPGTDVPDECGPTRVWRRSPAALRDVVVTGRDSPADRVVRLRLAAPGGALLPRWEPGAHLDLVLPDGVVRQYSLCGDPDAREYEIAVHDVIDGRGGSRWIHENLTTGQPLRIRGPRNHFPFDATRPAMFIAGGIGITPLAPMIRRAQALGLDWRLVFGGRTRSSMAFASEFVRLGGSRVDLVPQDTAGVLDLPAILKAAPPDAVVYACGPPAMLAAVEVLVADLPVPPELRLERFTAAVTDTADDVAFRIHLAVSGTSVDVPANRRALDVLLDAGIVIDNSCRNGLCGSCAVRVLDGTPDHRDALPGSARGDRMMVCVSRALTPEITLDA